MSLFGTCRNRNCPLVALLGAWPFESFGVYEDHWRTEKVAVIR